MNILSQFFPCFSSSTEVVYRHPSSQSERRQAPVEEKWDDWKDEDEEEGFIEESVQDRLKLAREPERDERKRTTTIAMTTSTPPISPPTTPHLSHIPENVAPITEFKIPPPTSKAVKKEVEEPQPEPDWFEDMEPEYVPPPRVVVQPKKPEPVSSFNLVLTEDENSGWNDDLDLDEGLEGAGNRQDKGKDKQSKKLGSVKLKTEEFEFDN
eukprot:TRINITY_DN5079_c4_g3_i1.p1 TRINITY_DN5079_c4_g3~~TRINITY_DN5079_c4_g3_i1.p1  ORF type:complete len:220 (+),score=71.31 TRINITY_DN5079_c4_g3_i1:31-660(+)